jgi:hypothetical protein
LVFLFLKLDKITRMLGFDIEWRQLFCRETLQIVGDESLYAGLYRDSHDVTIPGSGRSRLFANCSKPITKQSGTALSMKV